MQQLWEREGGREKCDDWGLTELRDFIRTFEEAGYISSFHNSKNVGAYD